MYIARDGERGRRRGTLRHPPCRRMGVWCFQLGGKGMAPCWEWVGGIIMYRLSSCRGKGLEAISHALLEMAWRVCGGRKNTNSPRSLCLRTCPLYSASFALVLFASLVLACLYVTSLDLPFYAGSCSRAACVPAWVSEVTMVKKKVGSPNVTLGHIHTWGFFRPVTMLPWLVRLQKECVVSEDALLTCRHSLSDLMS